MPGVISSEDYGVLCDAIERAWLGWPAEPDEANPFSHTSNYARQAANRIMRELDLEFDEES